MEMDPQERESDLGDDSPVSPNDDMTDGESGREQEDGDSGDDIRRHSGDGILGEHGDVLAKLKMQVRDIKQHFNDSTSTVANLNSDVANDVDESPLDEYDAARHMSFPSLPGRPSMHQNEFHIQSPFAFPHPSTAFMPPMMPPPTATSSGSSHSSEGSASSSQHTWSFEEQFKQLYEISDDPKRKEFLDDLFTFMQRRGSPINRLPIMAKSVLDLYELYNLVIARGGLVDVINKKLWQEIIKGLHLPSSITSAAFTLRTQYMKYLYPYECEKRHMSTPEELQVAIDGNRREGRRASYGYDAMQRSPNQQAISLSLAQQQQQQLAARCLNNMITMGSMTNGVHHPSHPQPMSQPHNGIPGMPPDLDARLMDYVKYVSTHGAPTAASTSPPIRLMTGSPPATSPLNPLWSLYRNPQPPVEPQQEALNLADSCQTSSKRESEPRESAQPSKKQFKGDPDEDKPQRHGAANISITNRVDAHNGGSSSMLVSMDINGVKYSGLLFASSSNNQTSPGSTHGSVS